jgi:hypothetical protein
MSFINKDNYEAWFLDYYEGALNPEQTEQLFKFLDANPHLYQVFNEYQNLELMPEQVNFDKNSLLKDIPKELINEISGTDYMAISYTENLLSNDEKNTVDKLIQEDILLKEAVSTYSDLKLKPDTSIVFKQKNKLKKPLIIPLFRYREAYKYTAIAVSIVITLISFWINFTDDKNKHIAGLGFHKKRPLQTAHLSKLNSESFNNADKQEVNQKLKDKNRINQKINVQPLKIEEPIILKELEATEKNDYEIVSVQDIEIENELDITENKIISSDISNNNVETLKTEKYLTPQDLIISKLLKSSEENILANDDTKKSFWWNALDLISKKYTDITNKKVKIKKVEIEDKSTVFAFVTDKFEIIHITTKK